MAFCTNCGKRVADEAAFCEACGSDLHYGSAGHAALDKDVNDDMSKVALGMKEDTDVEQALATSSTWKRIWIVALGIVLMAAGVIGYLDSTGKFIKWADPVLGAIVTVFSCVWVHQEEKKRNAETNSWSSFVFFLWGIGFPAYLWGRLSAIKKMESGVQKKDELVINRMQWAFFVVVMTCFGFDSYAKVYVVPACDANATVDLVEKIVNDIPVIKLVGSKFIELKEITQQGYNRSKDIRLCAGTVIMSTEESGLRYSVEKAENRKGGLYVEVQIVDNEQSADSSESIEQQVTADAVRQYEIAKRNGSAMDACVQAMQVSMSFLQANDEQNYAKWKDVERMECRSFGMPGH